MRWSDRQRAMLQAMGLRLWLPVDRSQPNVQPNPHSQPDAQNLAQGHSRDVASDVAQDVAQDVAVLDAPPAAPSAAVTVRRSAFEASPQVRRDAARVAAPESVASMDWTTLRETVAGCTACRLCESRRQTVFGVGHERAHWMIVGEAPGEEEDRRGEPFVGKSGQLLDNMLRSVGLSRADPASGGDAARQVYIANTVKCRPPGNRNPEPDELERCEAYLIRQVELVQPKIILAMGRFAVQRLLRSDEPIGRLRGRVHRYLEVPVVVMYHPSYLLRVPEDKAKAWDDLCLAVETMRSAEAIG